MRYLLAAMLLVATASSALAHEGMLHEGCAAGQSFAVGDIAVTGAFARATLPSAPVAAGYMTISNAGAAPDRLTGVTSEVAPGIEIHNMKTTADGMMKMEHLGDGLELPAGGEVVLAPGGLHIMFIGPNQPFKEGECVAVVLHFETAGDLPVELVVGPIGAAAAPDGHAKH